MYASWINKLALTSKSLFEGAVKKIETVSNGTNFNGAIPKPQYIKTNNQIPQQAAAPIQSTSTTVHTEDKMIPIQITLPAQPTIDSATRVLTIHVPASALNGPQLHTLLTGPVITATMGLPAPLASSLLQQHVNAALQQQMQQQQITQKTVVQGKLSFLRLVYCQFLKYAVNIL